MAQSWRLVNSFGCRAIGFREDTTFAAGRVQAANDIALRFGTGIILGFAVGGLRPRFRPKRVSLAQTALRLWPRRPAICAALCPEAQSSLSSAKSSAAQFMGGTYTLIAARGLVVPIAETDARFGARKSH
jgi:hypothetical protein